MDLVAPTEEDLERVAAVVAEACAVGYRGLFDEAALQALVTPDAIRERADRLREELASGEYEMVIAQDSGGVVGVIGWWGTDDSVEVESLYVRPDRWGGPTAERLVTTLARRVRPKRLELWTLAANTRARRFYERVGFHLVHARRDINYLARDVEQVRYSLETECRS